MNKIITYLSQYFGSDLQSKYPGAFKKSSRAQSFEIAIHSANHGIVFASRDELDSIDLRRL